MGWGILSYKGFEVYSAHNIFASFSVDSDYSQVITHNGGLPGFLTTVAFIPSQGLGVVSVINSDTGSSLGADLLWSILDHVEDPTSDYPSLPSRVEPAHPKTPPRPPNAASALTMPIESLVGTYDDSGYGSFTICSPMVKTSDACDDVISDFTTVYPDASPTTLYASWPRFWTSHLRLQHVGGTSFKMDVTTLFPAGYGKDTTPFAQSFVRDLAFEAEFAIEGGVVKGLAVYNGIATLPGFVHDERGEDQLRRAAAVFFTRV